MKRPSRKRPSRWLAPALFAMGCNALAFVAPVRAQDPVFRMRATPPEVRVLDGAAYYRDDGRDGDRPEARRGAYGRPIHFRFVPLDRHPMRNDSSHVDQPDDERAEVRRDAYGRPIYFRFIPLDKHPMRNDSYGNQYDDHRGQNER